MDNIMSRQPRTECIAQKRTKYAYAKSRRVKGRLTVGRFPLHDHLVRFAKDHPKITFARSRTGCCNDNAHGERKKSSLARTRFGYRRFDNPDLLNAINRLCVRWSDYSNLCVATCMTIGNVKCETKKSFTHHYDKPAARPRERCARRHALPSPALSNKCL